MAGTLYLVGTPIGNLEDITERARRVLGSVDVVAAEDTRRTGRLLKALGLRVQLMSFFEGNEADRVPVLIRMLSEGRDVAVVSDAGMPGVSDPGYSLVTACIEAGIAVDVIPGPSAVLAALVLSGMPTDRFVFEGFLPRSGRSRARRLEGLREEPRTIVLFESPGRLAATLRDLADVVGERRVAVAREMTKLHQEVIRGSLPEVRDAVQGRAMKGEVAVVIEGAPAAEDGPSRTGAPGREDEAFRMAADLVAAGSSKREAARRAREATGVPARMVYQELLKAP